MSDNLPVINLPLSASEAGAITAILQVSAESWTRTMLAGKDINIPDEVKEVAQRVVIVLERLESLMGNVVSVDSNNPPPKPFE